MSRFNDCSVDSKSIFLSVPHSNTPDKLPCWPWWACRRCANNNFSLTLFFPPKFWILLAFKFRISEVGNGSTVNRRFTSENDNKKSAPGCVRVRLMEICSNIGKFLSNEKMPQSPWGLRHLSWPVYSIFGSVFLLLFANPSPCAGVRILVVAISVFPHFVVNRRIVQGKTVNSLTTICQQLSKYRTERQSNQSRWSHR